MEIRVHLIQRVADSVKRLLAEPATAGLDLDAVETTSRRHALIESKRFLRQVYDEWYAMIAAELTPIGGPLLEIGSGGGFLATTIRGVITSDVLPLSGVDVVLDAAHLPFGNGSLRGVAMTNVLHHIPDVRLFLTEVMRCTKPGGVLVMIEPWVTPWSRWVYGSLHHEPFDPQAATWSVAAGRPLSAANGALPWIVFERDRRQFEREFQALRVMSIRPIMPLRYLLSGGVSMRALTPGWTFPIWRWIDDRLALLLPGTAMFAMIVVRRGDSPSTPVGSVRS
jgi:SAM-dependent methyltransferase